MRYAVMFKDLDVLAAHRRQDLESMIFFLYHSHNLAGKGRLSSVLKNFGRYPFNPTLLNKLVSDCNG